MTTDRPDWAHLAPQRTEQQRAFERQMADSLNAAMTPAVREEFRRIQEATAAYETRLKAIGINTSTRRDFGAAVFPMIGAV